MTSVLLFTLQAPMASWGDIAVGEWRGSWDRPSRSAIIGLLGAALGVLRNEAEHQSALVSGYRVAVRGDALGTPMQDYHTMQTVTKALLKKRNVSTRSELLAVPDKETVLSRREYRQGVICTVAVWSNVNARWTLVQLAAALRMPVFSLFAGRRSNPLGLPLNPEIVEAESLAAAFEVRPPVPAQMLAEFRQLRPRTGWGREVAHDVCEGFPSGLIAPLRQHVRRDVPTNRTGWLFEERVMEVGLLPSTGGLE